VAVPRCARHPKSKVWLDGSYGRPGHRRPRFKCVEGRHVFTEPLPRQQTVAAECSHCERPLASYEGAPAPRLQRYTTREIAATLIRVGAGTSYRRAAATVRASTHGHRISNDSSMVEDWIEIYAPVLTEALAPKEWPDVLVLDDSPFAIRTTHNRGGKEIVFRVYAALAYNPAGRNQLVRLEGFPDKRPASWQRFLSSLPGRPRLIVCDNETGMLTGIARTWPTDEHEFSPIIFLSHWHLKAAIKKLLKRRGYTDDGELDLQLGLAFASSRKWEEFDAWAHTIDVPTLHRWLDQRDPSWWAGDVTRSGRIAWQLNNGSGHPNSTGDLESKLRFVKTEIRGRVFALRNRERTNRMLGLMLLHLEGLDDVEVYAKLLRKSLAANGGLAAPRKQITDPRGVASLWR